MLLMLELLFIDSLLVLRTVRQEIRKQLKKEKQVKKTYAPQTPRNLSVHVAMPPPEDEDEVTSNPAIPVLNRDINAEVLMGNTFFYGCILFLFLYKCYTLF